MPVCDVCCLIWLLALLFICGWFDSVCYGDFVMVDLLEFADCVLRDCLRLWLLVVGLRCYVVDLLRGLLFYCSFECLLRSVLVLRLELNSVGLHVV